MTRNTMATLLMAALPALHAQAQVECVPADIELTQQGQLNTFYELYSPDPDTERCDTVTGNLRITGPNITNMFYLDDLVEVRGNLVIRDTTQLSGMRGLDNIHTVGNNLNIRNNSNLESLSGLDKVAGSVNRLQVRDNPQLESLSQLAGINGVEENLVIRNNDALVSLQGLQNITATGNHLDIRGNALLEDIQPLQDLVRVDNRVWLRNNPALTECGALSELLDGDDFNGDGPDLGQPVPDVLNQISVNNNGGASCNSLAALVGTGPLYYDAVTGDWATDSNWDPVASPAADREMYIFNDGVATESSAPIEAKLLIVGDTHYNGNGTLNVDGQSVSIDGQLAVGGQLHYMLSALAIDNHRRTQYQQCCDRRYRLERGRPAVLLSAVRSRQRGEPVPGPGRYR